MIQSIYKSATVVHKTLIQMKFENEVLPVVIYVCKYKPTFHP